MYLYKKPQSNKIHREVGRTKDLEAPLQIAVNNTETLTKQMKAVTHRTTSYNTEKQY